MSQISDYAAKVESIFGRLQTDFGTFQNGLATLNQQLADLQATAKANNGKLSADDQAALDKLVTDGSTLADSADKMASSLTAPPAPTQTQPPPSGDVGSGPVSDPSKQAGGNSPTTT